MTLKEMQQAGNKRTKAILGAWTKNPTGLSKDMLASYKTAYEEITKKLEAIYARLLSGVKPEDYYNVMYQRSRLENLLKEIVESYRQGSKVSARKLFNMSKIAMSNTYYNNMFSTNWFSNPFFSMIDEKAVEVSVYGTDKIWKLIKKANKHKYKAYLPKYGTLSERLNANATNDIKKIKQTITAGLRQGKSYVNVSKDLQKVFNTTASNAMRIARTEGNRNLNSGAYAQTQAAVDNGIEIKRRYVSVRVRSRTQSFEMDGQEVAPDQPFTYGGLSWFIPGNSGNPAYDCNDRCGVIDVIPGMEPTARRGRNPVTGKNEVASYQNHDEWMKDNGLKRDKNGKIY